MSSTNSAKKATARSRSTRKVAPPSCQEKYDSQNENDKPRVLLAMAIGLEQCNTNMFHLIITNNAGLRPQKQQLLEEAKRRYTILGLRKSDYRPVKPTTGWSVQQITQWLKQHPIQNEESVQFVLSTLEETAFGRLCIDAATISSSSFNSLSIESKLPNLSSMDMSSLEASDASPRRLPEAPLIGFGQFARVPLCPSPSLTPAVASAPSAAAAGGGGTVASEASLQKQQPQQPQQQTQPPLQDNSGSMLKQEQHQQQQTDLQQIARPQSNVSQHSQETIHANNGYRPAATNDEEQGRRRYIGSLGRDLDLHQMVLEESAPLYNETESEVSETALELESVQSSMQMSASGIDQLSINSMILQSPSSVRSKASQDSSALMQMSLMTGSSFRSGGSLSQGLTNMTMGSSFRSFNSSQDVTARSGATSAKLGSIHENGNDAMTANAVAFGSKKVSNGKTNQIDDFDFDLESIPATTPMSHQSAKVVRDKLLVDARGAKGRYSGESTAKWKRMKFSRLPTGRGRMIYEDGRRYEGDWLKGTWHGNGKLTLTNGTRYEGSFKEGVLDGQGQLHLIDGAVYAGEWNNDCGNDTMHHDRYLFKGTCSRSESGKGEKIHGFIHVRRVCAVSLVGNGDRRTRK